MDTVGIPHYICSEEDLVKAIILHNHGPPIKLPSNMPISPHSSSLKLQVTNPNKQWWWMRPCWCRWSKTSLFKNSTTEESPVGGVVEVPNISKHHILLATIIFQSRFCQYIPIHHFEWWCPTPSIAWTPQKQTAKKNATVERPSIQQVQLQCTERRNLASGHRRGAQWETTKQVKGPAKYECCGCQYKNPMKMEWESHSKPQKSPFITGKKGL